MRELNVIALANAKSKGKRPYFFDDPAVERVLAITMAVAGELAVVHERLDTIERLLESKGTLSRAEIEAYRPDAQAAEERQHWHAEYIARILRIVQQELEALQHPEANRDLEEIAEELSRT
ncbi:MAG: hypothetical protein RML40_01610 [Bacteroidota bacterium]|nr:hypothetical protein [Candidatus Kapabacteria bacterium]MDW8219205.1 hypothetical protein [Bacteroidota bacterium]